MTMFDAAYESWQLVEKQIKPAWEAVLAAEKALPEYQAALHAEAELTRRRTLYEEARMAMPELTEYNRVADLAMTEHQHFDELLRAADAYPYEEW